MKFDKRLIKMKKLFTLIAAASLMAACSEEVATNRSEGDKQYISFSVSDTQSSSTRAFVAPWYNEQTEIPDAEKCVVAVDTDLPTEYPLCLTITDEPFIHRTESNLTRGVILNSGDAAILEFGVTEYKKDGNTPYFSNTKPAYQNVTLDGGRALFKANEFWEYDSYDGIEYDFYAYAPHVSSSGQSGITLSSDNRTITYDAMGISVGNQPDLMTARKWTSSYVGAIPLNFQHRLCAIQIKTAGAWASGIHVSAVKFLNVISSGTFNIDTDKDADWDSKGAAGDYVVSGFNEADATNTVVTGPADKWLMMVPQTLSGAKLSITLTDGSSNSTILTAPINSTAWSAGHTVTYTISPEAISEITVNYPTGSARSWNDGSDPVTGPISTYATTDQFGLFVLDKDNKILISNQLVTPTAGDAAASRILDISFFKSKQYRYFLMYPYKDNATLQSIVGSDNYNNYYKEGATGRSASADAFFAEVISNWSPVNDQSAEATFKSQDLQIAKLSGDHFDMVHKMGLLACTLPDGIITDDVITYNGNQYDGTAEGEKWPKIDSKCTTMTWNASTIFTSSTDTPYNTGSVLYYVAKPTNAAIAFSTTEDANHYSWSVSGASTTVSTANAYKTFTITAPDLSSYYNKKVWEFSYSGAGKQWKAPFAGTFRLECWGAGNSAGYTAYGCGGGGYVAGNLSLDLNMDLYVFVGQTTFDPATSYAFNGGGYSTCLYGSSGPSGCGATDIRTTYNSNWRDAASLRSRIIVAGGAGAGGELRSNSGSAGGLDGYQGRHTSGVNYDAQSGQGGHQTSGGAVPAWYGGASTNGTKGEFGYGGIGGKSGGSGGGSGGGGGWYGASGACGAYSGSFAGGGGSSFISGHPYCNGINSSGTHQGEGKSSKVLYNGTGNEHTITLTDWLMIDGGGYKWTGKNHGSQQQMPNPNGGYYSLGTGHSGNGFARITYVNAN